jgi:hypothetical protein
MWARAVLGFPRDEARNRHGWLAVSSDLIARRWSMAA